MITRSITSFSNPYYVALSDSVATLIDQYGPENLGLSETFLTGYQGAIQALKDAVNKPRASSMTKEIHDADKQRDRLYRYIRTVLLNTRLSPDAQVAALYPTIQSELLSIYPAKLCREAIHKEYAHIEGFVIDVNRVLSRHMEKLGLTDAVSKLSQANRQFLESFNSRNAEKQFRLDTTKLRKDVQGYFDRMKVTVNYFAQLTDSTIEAEKDKCHSCQGMAIDVENVIKEYYTRAKADAVGASGSGNGDGNGNGGQNGGTSGNGGSTSGNGGSTSGNGGPTGSNNSGNGTVSDELNQGTTKPGDGTTVKP
ncbi:MAG: hypothetical protein KBT20_04260 [Bacteroidales bacterium]|nr:hypothetical protein [Candidatus Liminaster caballi]